MPMADGADEADGSGGFFFIRHGQTTANRDGVRSGAESDVHLTELGREQARAASRLLHGLGVTPSLILCSPLSRTIETAHLVNACLGLEIRIETGLIERRLGDWNGRGVEETQAALTAGKTPPGGESGAAFKARVLAAFRGLAPLRTRWPLIVSSRGVARILMEHAGREGAAVLANGALLRVTLAGVDHAGNITIARIAEVAKTAELEPQEEIA